MFRFHWNHHQALLQKHTDPLHRITKMRYGIPDAYVQFMFTIHVSIHVYPDRAVRKQRHVYCKHKLYVNVWDPITHFSNSM